MSRRNSSKGGATANNVYIRDDQYAWVPARLVDSNKETAKVAIPQYKSEENIASDGGAGAVGFKSAVVQLKDYPGRALPLQNCGKDGKLKEVDDMVDLPYLHEVRNEENESKKRRVVCLKLLFQFGFLIHFPPLVVFLSWTLSTR